MCCSELIKTFDFFPECACLGMRVHACVCVCRSKYVSPAKTIVHVHLHRGREGLGVAAV